MKYRVRLYVDVDATTVEGALYEVETALYEADHEYTFEGVEQLAPGEER